MNGNKMMNENDKSKIIKSYVGVLIFAALFIGVVILFPERKDTILSESTKYFIEMLLIIPSVMLFIGLFGAWISKEQTTKYLGKESGTKGALIAIIIGSLPTGPLYMSFPIASSLLKKGASMLNIIVFLGACACLKIPQGLVELKFMGISL